jgi:hypothetical protein
MYSKTRLLELIASGREDETIFQQRVEKFTITNGTLVLEKGYPCPPLCGNEDKVEVVNN